MAVVEPKSMAVSLATPKSRMFTVDIAMSGFTDAETTAGGRLLATTATFSSIRKASNVEKQELVASFKRLSPNQLSKVVDIIRAAVPRGGEIADGSDYLIPLVMIDDTTLIRLRKLMNRNH